MRILIAIAAAIALGLLFVFRPLHAPSAAARDGDAASSAPASAVRAAPRPQASPLQTLVYVAGEVTRPGVYPVAVDARVNDAVARAGGMRPGADSGAVNLAAHVRDGDEILVPARGAETRAHPGRHQASGSRHRSHGHHRRPAHGDSAMVDLNAADAALLATVPGIGSGLAQRIVAFREANGPFTSADELLDISGITDRRLDALLPYVVAR